MPKRRRPANVIDFAAERSRRQLHEYGAQIGRVLDANRRAIGRLYSTGAMFSRPGARAGRDLLLAHQHLLKVMKLLQRLRDEGEVPAPRRPTEIAAVYAELDALLDRTSALTSRTGTYLARLHAE